MPPVTFLGQRGFDRNPDEIRERTHDAAVDGYGRLALGHIAPKGSQVHDSGLKPVSPWPTFSHMMIRQLGREARHLLE